MKNKIAIIANGTIDDINFHKNLLKDVDIIICADGGAYNAKKMGIVPDYIIGDLDSASSSIIQFFKNEAEIIEDPDQYKTDLEKALSLAESLNPCEILILGAIGDRIDHTIANIWCLNYIKTDVKAQIIDEKNSIELVENSMDITGDKDDIVSIIPLTDVSGLTYKGMKWLLSNADAKYGWFGISNRLSEKNAKVSLTKGKLLVIRVKDV